MSRPSRKLPDRLTVRVPPGNAPGQRCWTAWSTTYRSGAPTAAATMTRASIIGRSSDAARGVLVAAADVLDHLDVVEDHQSLGDQLVQLRQERRKVLGRVDDHDRQRQVLGQAEDPGGVDAAGRTEPLD